MKVGSVALRPDDVKGLGDPTTAEATFDRLNLVSQVGDLGSNSSLVIVVMNLTGADLDHQCTQIHGHDDPIQTAARPLVAAPPELDGWGTAGLWSFGMGTFQQHPGAAIRISSTAAIGHKYVYVGADTSSDGGTRLNVAYSADAVAPKDWFGRAVATQPDPPDPQYATPTQVEVGCVRAFGNGLYAPTTNGATSDLVVAVVTHATALGEGRAT